MAFTLGFTRSICFKCASNSSRADSFFLRTRSASVVADSKQREGSPAEANGVAERERRVTAVRRVMPLMLLLPQIQAHQRFFVADINPSVGDRGIRAHGCRQHLGFHHWLKCLG